MSKPEGHLITRASPSLHDDLSTPAAEAAVDSGASSVPTDTPPLEQTTVGTSRIGISASYALRLQRTRDVLAMTFVAKGGGWDSDDVIQDVLITLAARASQLEPLSQAEFDRYAILTS